MWSTVCSGRKTKTRTFTICEISYSKQTPDKELSCEISVLIRLLYIVWDLWFIGLKRHIASFLIATKTYAQLIIGSSIFFFFFKCIFFTIALRNVTFTIIITFAKEKKFYRAENALFKMNCNGLPRMYFTNIIATDIPLWSALHSG